MKHAAISLVFALCVLLCAGCECPPAVETPKIIYPENFAKVTFLNVVYSGSSIDITTNYGLLIQELLFGYNSTYTEVGSGTNVINIRRNSETLYSVPISLRTDSLYTAVFSGNSSRDISVKIIEDGELSNFSGEPLLRLVNVDRYSSDVSVKCSAFDSLAFPTDMVTEFRSLGASQAEQIELFKDGEQLYNFRFSVGADYAYTFVVSYSPTAKNKYGINISLISIKYRG